MLPYTSHQHVAHVHIVSKRNDNFKLCILGINVRIRC